MLEVQDILTGEIAIELRAHSPSGVQTDELEITDWSLKTIRFYHQCLVHPLQGGRMRHHILHSQLRRVYGCLETDRIHKLPHACPVGIIERQVHVQVTMGGDESHIIENQRGVADGEVPFAIRQRETIVLVVRQVVELSGYCSEARRVHFEIVTVHEHIRQLVIGIVDIRVTFRVQDLTLVIIDNGNAAIGEFKVRRCQQELGVSLLVGKHLCPNGKIDTRFSGVLAHHHIGLVKVDLMENEFERLKLKVVETSFNRAHENHVVVVVIADAEIVGDELERGGDVDILHGNLGAPFLSQLVSDFTDDECLHRRHKEQPHDGKVEKNESDEDP